MNRLFILPAALAAALLAAPAPAQKEVQSMSANFKVHEVTNGQGIIWGITFADADTLLFTERSGRLKRLQLSSGEVRNISGVPEVFARGQGGLLDVAVGPNHGRDGWIYFTYSKAVRGQGRTTLARARLNGEQLQDWEDLLVTQSASGSGRHYGSRIAFDGEGHLFFGVGDRGVRPNGQNLRTHAGAMLRLNLDGSVPDDNPMVGRDDALDEIWSWGHRNPQGLAFGGGRLWEGEHGPRGGDEINIVKKGANYGWAQVSHGREYSSPARVGEATEREDVEPAIQVYVPSIAPSDMLYYSGDAFPGWRGNLFQGALKLTHLNRIAVDADGRVLGEERLLADMRERIRSLEQGPDGHIYMGTDSGRIYRIAP